MPNGGRCRSAREEEGEEERERGRRDGEGREDEEGVCWWEGGEGGAEKTAGRLAKYEDVKNVGVEFGKL